MSKVWVVMGNDFPAAVYTNPKAALKHREEMLKKHVSGTVFVYWKSYEFDLLEEFKDA